jgi:hypothetical protein
MRPERRGDRVASRPGDHEIAVLHDRDGRGFPLRSGRIAGGAEVREGPRRERGIARENGARVVPDDRAAQVGGERPQPREGGRRRERRRGHAAPGTTTVGPGRDNGGVTVSRIAWLATVLACLLTCVALLVWGYQGYAAVFFAVGACAAINLT